ncbi:hypothetical protein ACFVIM_33900, partial [Streptomyces sp. NPDC057638]
MRGEQRDGTPARLDDLAGRSGAWLGRSTAPVRHTTAVVADHFDRIAWQDAYEQSTALRDLAEELGDGHDHAVDLLADTFLGAYKVRVRLREPGEMEPSRLLNHRVITFLTETPDFDELRRETVGDPYAAAMAVLAQAAALRLSLARSRESREAAERARRAQRAAGGAATAVAGALRRAADRADGEGAVPAPDADSVD